MRHLIWFSCGAASAVTAKLTLNDHPDALVVRCFVDNEHPDNNRFAQDCARWFNSKIIEIRSAKYKDCWDVWERERYLNGIHGAKCTLEMKKKPRQAFQQTGDIQYFGFTAQEKHRAVRFTENNLEVDARFPLIDKGLSKRDCFRALLKAGIALPEMYRLGYFNANCVGCVKGGVGYWNKIRQDFPCVFKRTAQLERTIGASMINGRYLDEIGPREGYLKDLELPECGLFCTGLSL